MTLDPPDSPLAPQPVVTTEQDSQGEPLLAAQSVGRRHPSEWLWLLREIDLTICGGDRLALVGPSGSGKSLFARALSLLDPIDSGEVLWKGERVESPDVPAFRRQVIYLHQRPWLGDASVEDSLRQPWGFHTTERLAEELTGEQDPHRLGYDSAKIARWLEAIGRSPSFLAQKATNLSGGESQIAALIRALQLDPRVLLLDEPTSAMDQETTHAAESLIKTWLAEAPQEKATLWITHDSEQANRVSKKLIEIRSGRLQQNAQHEDHPRDELPNP